MNDDGAGKTRIGKAEIHGRKAVRRVTAGAAKVRTDGMGAKKKSTTAANKKCRGPGVPAAQCGNGAEGLSATAVGKAANTDTSHNGKAVGTRRECGNANRSAAC